MQLTTIQKQEIWENGYTVARGVVPPVMVEAAKRAINNSLGEGMEPSQMPTLRAQSYCPEVKNTPVIVDLFNRTPAFSLAESVLGEGNFGPALGGGQIALRFPMLRDPAPKAGPHLDGMSSPTNGVSPGTIGNFSMLVGVLLSDLPEPNSGNFTVWPGTHRSTAKYFEEHGADAFLEGMPKIEMPEPVQIMGKAGDVVLCHYQVAHGITANSSPNIRYAIFFRLKHKDHDSHHREVLSDIWRDWPGMAEVRKGEEEKGK